jgi:hypothetical protein
MADEQRQHINLQLNVPLITPFGKQAAKEIANAKLIFDVDGKKEQFLIYEVTPEVLKTEATRIASIQDTQLRDNAILECLHGCVYMMANCQKIASEYCRIADELQTLAQQLEVMQKLKGIDVHGSDTTQS